MVHQAVPATAAGAANSAFTVTEGATAIAAAQQPNRRAAKKWERVRAGSALVIAALREGVEAIQATGGALLLEVQLDREIENRQHQAEQ